jgi:hypothetical protein
LDVVADPVHVQESRGEEIVEVATERVSAILRETSFEKLPAQFDQLWLKIHGDDQPKLKNINFQN